jgi:hypothetical protein
MFNIIVTIVIVVEGQIHLMYFKDDRNIYNFNIAENNL